MFGFVKTEEKQKFIDNNNLVEERKRRERNFTVIFIIFAFSIINLTLYLLTKS